MSVNLTQPQFGSPGRSDLVQRLQHALGSDYRVTSKLGEGGCAVVFLVDDLRLKRKLAVKVMSPAFAVANDSLERFIREAETIAQLAHPNVVPVHFVGRVDNFFYIAMQYVDGGSLAARLEREGRLPVDDVVRIVREVAGGLAHAHKRGIVHRDVKPQNVLVDAESGRCLVADFGVAQTGESTLTWTGAVVGTPAYLAPEQVMGEACDQRADIYALGVMGYELLVGAQPFEAPTPVAAMLRRLSEPAKPIRELRPDVPSSVASVIHRCLALSTDDRYQSAAEVFMALEPAALTASLGDAETVREVPLRRRMPKFVAGLVAVAALITAGKFADSSIRAGGFRTVARTPANVMETLKLARQSYYSGDYVATITRLRDVADDVAANQGNRKEALRYLARSYLATGSIPEARNSLRKMVRLEPPISLLIPGLESDRLMQLYLDVRAEKAAAMPSISTAMAPIEILGVFPFQQIGNDTAFASLRDGIAALLINRLQVIPELRFVDRMHRDIADVGDSTYYEIENVLRAGVKQRNASGGLVTPLAATDLLFGSYVVNDGKLLITAWIFNMKTGQLRLSQQVLGEMSDGLGTVDGFCNKVANDIARLATR